MPIKVVCPGCKKTINAPDKYAGRQANCPGCGTSVKIPGSATEPAKPTVVEQQAAKRLPPPQRAVTPPPPSPPQPVVYEEPPTIRPPHVTASVVVDHHHKAKGGAFRTGFGMMFGCLLAIVAFTVIGFLGCGIIFSTVNDAVQEAQEKARQQIASQPPPVSSATPAKEEEMPPADLSVPAPARTAPTTPAEATQSAPPTKPINLLQVSAARFYRDRDSFSISPTIEITVRNGTGRAISRIFFHGKLQTPGRALPWAEDDFNYTIPGGLEPGESQSWKLSPGFSSKFYNVADKADARFDVSVVDFKWAGED